MDFEIIHIQTHTIYLYSNISYKIIIIVHQQNIYETSKIQVQIHPLNPHYSSLILKIYTATVFLLYIIYNIPRSSYIKKKRNPLSWLLEEGNTVTTKNLASRSTSWNEGKRKWVEEEARRKERERRVDGGSCTGWRGWQTTARIPRIHAARKVRAN